MELIEPEEQPARAARLVLLARWINCPASQAEAGSPGERVCSSQLIPLGLKSEAEAV
jgi:hypothetical protein